MLNPSDEVGMERNVVVRKAYGLPPAEYQQSVESFCRLFQFPDRVIRRGALYSDLTRYLTMPVPSSPAQEQVEQPHLSPRTYANQRLKSPAIEFMKPYLGTIISDVIRVCRDEQSHPIILAALDFLRIIFLSEEALYECLCVPSGGSNLFDTFRTLFISSLPLEVKLRSVKVLLTMLQTERDEFLPQADDAPSILTFLINADLDHYLMMFMHSDEKSIFNDVHEVFSIIMSFPSYSKGRIVKIMDHSLRVADLTICDKGFNRKIYFDFLWTACKALCRMPTAMENRILHLFESLLFSSWDLGDEHFVNLGIFATFITQESTVVAIHKLFARFMDTFSLHIISKLLDIVELRSSLVSVIVDDANFLTRLEESLLISRDSMADLCIQAFDVTTKVVLILEEEDSFQVAKKIDLKLSSFVTSFCRPISPWKPLKLLVFLLHRDFKTRLLNIEVADEEKVRNTLNMVELIIQSFALRPNLSREDSDVIWAGLREHQKYLIRRYEKFRPSIPDDSGDSLCKFVKTPNFIKDHLFKLSTRSFLLVFTQTNSLRRPLLTALNSWTIGSRSWNAVSTRMRAEREF